MVFDAGDQIARLQRAPQDQRAWANIAAQTWSRQNGSGGGVGRGSDATTSPSTAKSLPEFSLCNAEHKPLADRMEDQKDKDLGTNQKPVNENCQTTAVKNAFHFYDKDCDAAKVAPEMQKMLDNIKNNGGKGMDFDKLGKAFDQNKLDHLSPEQAKQAAKHGDLSPFVGQMPGNKNEAYANPEAMTAYLAEKGCNPESVKLGSDAAAKKVMDALDSGKPVILADKDTRTLYEEQAHAKGVSYDQMGDKVAGHTYMAYKDKQNEQYYVMDNTGKPQMVEKGVLEKKLHDSNSGATIVNKPPDDKFLQH